jgi:preprotein translocase subunit SecG
MKGRPVQTVFMILFLLTAVMLILLVLIQKGRGGGLAGAFGGPGGHSAFGTKTADVFIKATAVLGAIFFLLSMATAWVVGPEDYAPPPESPPAEAPAETGAGGPDAPDDAASPSDTEGEDEAAGDPDADAGN